MSWLSLATCVRKSLQFSQRNCRGLSRNTSARPCIREASSAVYSAFKKNAGERAFGANPQFFKIWLPTTSNSAARPGSALSGGEGLGLALFLRRGMTAWMQAWSECATLVEPGTRSQPRVEATIPPTLRTQITALLAGMILCLQQEAAS